MVTHFDRCLGCMACVTACPSGVQYDRLIERTRPQIERHATRARGASARYRAAIFALFTHPGRLRALAPRWRSAALGAQRSRSLELPSAAAARDARARAADVTARAAFRRLPEVDAGARHERGTRRASCRAASSACSSATSTPPPCACSPPRAGRSTRRAQPRCCGALQMHAGVEDEALGARARDDRRLRGLRRDRRQRRRLRLGDEGLRAPARRRPRVGRARRGVLAPRSRDVHELLAEHEPRPCATRSRCKRRLPRRLPPRPRPGRPRASRASCCAGSRASSCVEPAEWELCCGSAGIYNLLQPEAAAKLGARKADEPARHRRARRSPPPTRAARCRSPRTSSGRVPIYHPMTLLDRLDPRS